MRKLVTFIVVFVRATLPACAECFVRGDSNCDGTVDISDPIFSLSSLFLGGPEGACADAADANDDGALDLSDPIFTLYWRFLGADFMPAPFPRCAEDPTSDRLDCERGACQGGASSGAPDRIFVLKSGRVGTPYDARLPAFFREEILHVSAVGPRRVKRLRTLGSPQSLPHSSCHQWRGA